MTLAHQIYSKSYGEYWSTFDVSTLRIIIVSLMESTGVPLTLAHQIYSKSYGEYWSTFDVSTPDIQ